MEGDGLEQNRGFQGSVEDLQEVEEGRLVFFIFKRNYLLVNQDFKRFI